MSLIVSKVFKYCMRFLERIPMLVSIDYIRLFWILDTLNARFLMTRLLLFSEPGNISVIVVVDADKLVPSFYSVPK